VLLARGSFKLAVCRLPGETQKPINLRGTGVGLANFRTRPTWHSPLSAQARQGAAIGSGNGLGHRAHCSKRMRARLTTQLVVLSGNIILQRPSPELVASVGNAGCLYRPLETPFDSVAVLSIGYW
jgi:hypothetical protein